MLTWVMHSRRILGWHVIHHASHWLCLYEGSAISVTDIYRAQADPIPEGRELV